MIDLAAPPAPVAPPPPPIRSLVFDLLLLTVVVLATPPAPLAPPPPPILSLVFDLLLLTVTGSAWAESSTSAQGANATHAAVTAARKPWDIASSRYCR